MTLPVRMISFLRRWYEDNEPESIAIPDYENRILEQVQTKRMERTRTTVCALFRQLAVSCLPAPPIIYVEGDVFSCFSV